MSAFFKFSIPHHL